MFDFAKSDAGLSFCWSESPAGNFLVIMGCRWLKRLIVAIAMTNRIKEPVIKPGMSHRRLAFDLFTCFVSMVLGMVKNESVSGDFSSIFFKAFRMELKLIILYPNSIIVRIRSRAGGSLGGRLKSGISYGCRFMILYSAGASRMNL